MGVLIKALFNAATLEMFLIKPVYVKNTRLNRETQTRIICLINVISGAVN